MAANRKTKSAHSSITKTASSGRMAEFLGGDGGGVIGFGAVSGHMMGGWEEMEEGAGEEVHHGVGAEFQVVLKQLGKRDSTTKLKALQEFASLCQREPQDSIVSVLTLWTIMYNKLSMDNDNRVREASHKALQSCVDKVKNALGPHLKGIIGCWVSGMCDPHGPAASAAQSAFAAAFPMDRQRSVFKFGFRAIFTHAEDMILKETPDTFSDPKVVPSDERLRRYERALLMAVYSLHLSLQQLSADHLQESRDAWEPLLSEKRVWKLTRHHNPFIRAATFSLVSTVCKQVPEVIQSNAKQFCSTVLGSLGESEPVVIGPLWEAALLVVTHNESWSNHVNVQKALLPGLWSLLAAGGYGSAKVAYPCLLPLLSKLVEQVFASDVNFARSFLDRLKSGLQADRVRSSRAECEVVMRTYTECFLHLLFHMDPSESKRDVFYQDLLSRVVELMEYSLCQCPSVQCEVLYCAIPRLIDGLLQARTRSMLLEPHVTHLQSLITERVTQLMEAAPDTKVSFTRLGELFKYVHSPPKRTAHEKKSVAFSDSSPKPETDQTDTVEEREDSSEHIVNFMWPALCSVCAKNIAEVFLSAAESHSSLLLTLLHTYGDNKSLVKSVYSSLEANHPGVLLPAKSASSDEQKLLVICATLSKALNSEGLLSESLLTENVTESVILLLYCGIVDDDSAAMFLNELVKQCPPLLPLVLLKLNSADKKLAVRLLLATCHDKLQTLMADITDTSSESLWRFLELLITKPSETVFAKIRIVDTVFERVCEMLHNAFHQSDTHLSVSSMRKLLLIMSKADSSLVEKHVEDGDWVASLMGCLLHWCLHGMDGTGLYSGLLCDVASCYVHLLLTLPELNLYLQSLPSLLMGGPDSEEVPQFQRCLHSAVVFYALHCNVMNSAAVFWDVYHSIVSTASSIEDDFVPLAGLETFCRGSLLYFPLFDDLSSDHVTTTLSSSLQLAVFPAVALCDPALLEGILVQNVTHDRTELEPNLESVLSVISGVEWVENAKAVLCDCDGDEGVQKTLAKNWRMLIISLSLALTSLQGCQLRSLSPLEVKLVGIFSSALERSLMVGTHRKEWLKPLVLGIADKAAMEGSLWCLILRQLFAAVERVCAPDNLDVMNELVGLLLDEPMGSVLHSTLSGLTSLDLYRNKMLAMMQERESDVCLLVCGLCLFPECEQLQSMGARGISTIATKQGNSEITLFESITESCQDPMTFSVLELTASLVRTRKLPSEAWDFALCSLVTLTQLLVDHSEGSSVNQTVLFCHVMQLCGTVAQFLASPSAPTQQTTEWLEFFQPALQGCLLPYFTKAAGCPLAGDPCLTYQQYYVSMVAVSLGTEPLRNASLEDLVKGVLSDFYPRQVAAFILAKRMFSSLRIYASASSQNSDNNNNTPISLSSLQTLLSKALEKVDMDLAFLEDSQSEGCHNTTTYLFLWMLIIEAMSHCDPEARGVMGEWLKELSLFDHLLHGLFKFIGETTSASGRREELEVTLTPNLEQLAYLAYSAVARQLPSLLRQWYLSVDRQTSTMVNKFTSRLVSPALQQAELQTINKSNTTIGNMEVHVYAGASEVSVVYKVDEFSIELFVCLPENYPLQPPTIREGKRARVDPAQWRKWMLQLNVFMANQNGSLLDGLLLWKSNLDKHFSGVDDCMICFSVIHGSNYSVPKMICKTCKKKFHAACLYKWFSTSSKSTCPLCRNIF